MVLVLLALRNAVMKYKLLLFLILTAGLLVRMILAFGFEGTGDTGGWRLGSITGLHKKDLGMGDGTIYDPNCTAQCANWPPLTYHYMIGVRWVYETLQVPGIDDHGYYKILSVVLGTACIYLLYVLLKQRDPENALVLAAFYALHPVALYVTGYHGQRDIIWIFGLLLSAYVLQKERYILSAVIFAIGFSIKLPLIFFFPLLMLWNPTLKKRAIFTVIVVITAFGLALPEAVIHPHAVLNQVIGYAGWHSWWGISGVVAKLLTYFGFQEYLTTAYLLEKYLLYGAILLSTWYARKVFKELLFQAFFVLTTILVFIPSFSSQALIWILPFLILYYSRYYLYTIGYSITATLAAMAFYTVFSIQVLEQALAIIHVVALNKVPLFVYPLDLTFPVWIVVVLLWVRLLRDAQRHQTPAKIGFVESRESISNYIQWRQNRSQASIEKIKAHVNLRNSVVVDIGCGYGPLCKLLAQESKKVIGTEVDSFKLKVARKELRKFKNVELHQVHDEQLPIKTKSVDAIILFDVIEHIENPELMIQECYRCLKPGGILYVEFTPYYNFVGHHLYDFAKWPIHILPEAWIKQFVYAKQVRGVFDHDYYWAQFKSLNKMRITEFKNYVRNFQVIETHHIVKYPEVFEVDIPIFKYFGYFTDFFTMSFEGFYKKQK